MSDETNRADLPIRRTYRVNPALCAIALAGILCNVPALGADKLEDLLEQKRLAWNEYLDKSCTTSTTESAVRKLMDKKYREMGYARANNEVYRLLYLVDDYHQVEFAFHNDGKLLMTPEVERKGRWIRSPDGQVTSIPDPIEVALKAKIASQAIEYVAKRTTHTEALLPHVTRGDKAHAWKVVVGVDSLAADTPNYLLEIAADGTINERRPIEGPNAP